MSVLVNDIFGMWPSTYQMVGVLEVQSALATVDADNEKVAGIMQVPKSGDIEYVYLGIGAIAVTPGANVDIRIETVSATTGNPTGTLFGTNSNYGWDMSGANTYALNKVGPLTSNCTVSRGNYIAIVYVPPTSPNQGDVDFGGHGDVCEEFPYSKFYNGTSWVPTSFRWTFGIYYSDGSVGNVPDMLYSANVLALNRNSSSTYPNFGIEAKPLVNMTVSGMWANLDLDSDAEFKLISGTDTIEGTIALDASYRPNASYNTVQGYFSSPISLTAGTLYKFVVESDTTTNIYMGGPRCSDNVTGISNPYSHMANPFSDWRAVEGELTTPTWQTYSGGLNVFPMIGPIIRSIG